MTNKVSLIFLQTKALYLIPRKTHHTTSVPVSLHWLPATGLNLKCCNQLKAVNGLAQPDLSALLHIQPLARALRSSNQLLLDVPKAKLKTKGFTCQTGFGDEGWSLQILTSCNIKMRTSRAHRSVEIVFYLDLLCILTQRCLFFRFYYYFYDVLELTVMKVSQNSVRKTILHVHQSWKASIYPLSATYFLSWSNHGQSHVASKFEKPSFFCSHAAAMLAQQDSACLHSLFHLNLHPRQHPMRSLYQHTLLVMFK